jgi:hypothetical protein
VRKDIVLILRCGLYYRPGYIGPLTNHERPRYIREDVKSLPAATRRLHARVRRRCLALEGAVEEFPWGGTGVYKVRGKIFAGTGMDGSRFSVGFKPPDEEREDALALPFVRVADYVGPLWMGPGVADEARRARADLALDRTVVPEARAQDETQADAEADGAAEIVFSG